MANHPQHHAASPNSACRKHRASRRSRPHVSLPILFAIASLSCTALAQDYAAAPVATAVALASDTVLLVDEQGSPVMGGRLRPESFWDDDELLLRRGGDDDDKTSSSTAETTTSANKPDNTNAYGGGSSTTTTSSSSEASKTSTRGSPTTTTMTTPVSKSPSSTAASSASTPASASPLPSAFDETPSSAFTTSGSKDSCPAFIKDLLSSDTFQSCYPISMMVQTSTGFFDAEKQVLSIVRVLDTACSANSEFCTTFLNEAASNLTKSANCGDEYSQSQYSVMEAYNGLRAYQMMYAATCLQAPQTDMYCFASAVTNVTNPSDTNFYFMPYGYDLPGASTPSCDWCTQQTMAIFRSASADRAQPIASVYSDAARQINTLCGPTFVNSTLPKAEVGAASVSMPAYALTIAGVCVAALVNLLL